MEKGFRKKLISTRLVELLNALSLNPYYSPSATPMFLLLLSAICPDMNISYSLGDSLLH